MIQGSEPFCLVVASNEPHTPHKGGGYKPEEVPVPPFLPDLPAVRQGIADYYTDVDALDKEVGDPIEVISRQAVTLWAHPKRETSKLVNHEGRFQLVIIFNWDLKITFVQIQCNKVFCRRWN